MSNIYANTGLDNGDTELDARNQLLQDIMDEEDMLGTPDEEALYNSPYLPRAFTVNGDLWDED